MDVVDILQPIEFEQLSGIVQFQISDDRVELDEVLGLDQTPMEVRVLLTKSGMGSNDQTVPWPTPTGLATERKGFEFVIDLYKEDRAERAISVHGK